MNFSRPRALSPPPSLATPFPARPSSLREKLYIPSREYRYISQALRAGYRKFFRARNDDSHLGTRRLARFCTNKRIRGKHFSLSRLS